MSDKNSKNIWGGGGSMFYAIIDFWILPATNEDFSFLTGHESWQCFQPVALSCGFIYSLRIVRPC
jgi:hypothetical protein